MVIGEVKPWCVAIMLNWKVRAIAYGETQAEAESEAEKITSCLNSCEGIENPGEAIPAMICALKKSLEVVEHLNRKAMNEQGHGLELSIRSALALISTR